MLCDFARFLNVGADPVILISKVITELTAFINKRISSNIKLDA